MPIVLRVAPAGMSLEKYKETVKRLEEAGVGSPAGRLYHVCFGDENNVRVSDIWDSMESFEKFGEKLRPILADLGIDAGPPEVLEVLNIIEGAKSQAA